MSASLQDGWTPQPQIQEQPEPEPCDHDWRIQDESFSHEFGTEVIVCWACEKCGATKPAKDRDFYHDEP